MIISQEQFIVELINAKKQNLAPSEFAKQVSSKYNIGLGSVMVKYYKLKKTLENELKTSKTSKTKKLKGFISELTLNKKRTQKQKNEGIYELVSRLLK